MSTLLEKAPASQEVVPALTEAYYTICPVLTASNVAVELGWLDEEFERAGGKAVYLRSLADNAGWIPHYTHSLDNLFRDGGSIPTIQVKADLKDTKLIGLTWGQRGGQIVVRSNSRIHRVADLKGKKIGLTKSLNDQKIDFSRATAHRGILLALDLAGLTSKDVQIVDVEDADVPKFRIAKKPAELWAQSKERRNNPHYEVDLVALREGKIDAIYSSAGRSETLVKTGEYTVIEDLSLRPDWTLQVANGPYTLAVDTQFADRHPEIVVAFLRASIRAGRWINEHRGAAAEIFERVTFNSAPLIEQLIQGLDLVPQLTPKNLAATEIQKDFLLEHGYIKKDFDVRKWADPSFLEAALKSL